MSDLPAVTLQRALAQLLGDDGGAQVVEELGGGTYNHVLGARLGDGREVVVKVSPSSDAPGLSYEGDLLRTEAEYFRLALGQGAPVPQVVAYSEALLPGRAVLVLSRLQGTNLSEASRSINTAATLRVLGELGEAVGRVHGLSASGFGYPFRQQRFWHGSWSDAFGAMLAALIDDADRFAVDLPVPARRLQEFVQACRPALDEVTVPALVHFDLWDGNLLVGAPSGGSRLSGIVDAERAMYADPAFELPSLALSRALDREGGFLAGYARAGRAFEPTASLEARVALYTVYLYLVMLVEAAPRHYPKADAKRNRDRCVSAIASQLAMLTHRA